MSGVSSFSRIHHATQHLSSPHLHTIYSGPSEVLVGRRIWLPRCGFANAGVSDLRLGRRRPGGDIGLLGQLVFEGQHLIVQPDPFLSTVQGIQRWGSVGSSSATTLLQTGMIRRAESSLCSLVRGLLHRSIVLARAMLLLAHHDSHHSHSYKRARIGQMKGKRCGQGGPRVRLELT